MAQRLGWELDHIVISSPCTEPWEQMTGDEQRRRCAACRLDVHNIAAMQREDAERLFQDAQGRVCARIYRRPDGTVLTADCEPARNRIARGMRRVRVALTGILALLGFASCRGGPTPDMMVTTGVVMPQMPDEAPAIDGQTNLPEDMPSSGE